MNANSTAHASHTRLDLRADRIPDRPGPRHGGLQIAERVQALRDKLHAVADRRQAITLRADVVAGRDFVRGWNAHDVSQNTRDRYASALKHMATTGQRPEDANSKHAFYFRRAAVVHDARDTVKTALRDLDKYKRLGDVDRATQVYKSLRNGLETLQRYPPSTGNREDDLKRVSAYCGPRETDPERSNGKRESIQGLPSDWRDRVQTEASPRDKTHLAVMSLTGARPSELGGVKVRRNSDQISVTIKGAKVGDDRGVPERTQTFSETKLERSQAGRDLLEWLGQRGQRTTPKLDAGNFGDRISRAADRAGLPEVSAYTYRHSTFRNMKDAGIHRADIANRMGHRSDRSQTQYG